MIRFINLTGQIYVVPPNDSEPHFAWFDTIVDEFMRFNDSQEWNNWNEFVDDLTEHLKEDNISQNEATEILERFKRLYQFKISQTNLDLSSKE